MLNRYKNGGLSEEQQEALQDDVEAKADESKDFLKSLLTAKGFSAASAVAAVPFIGYLAFLAIVYIANRHFAEDSVREIDTLSKEVKYLSWEYKSLKADLMLKSTQGEVARKVDTIGLKALVEPPKKIVIGQENIAGK
ncbi:FtsL-like putative cell division protein [Olivibacter sp. CPCC 100613]|uniref:FtsL-like putative cell division protein n=1 Tax=Olivibacter sp. CPCC 100613 TaxID=3079931 RepID=UPI002FF8EF53